MTLFITVRQDSMLENGVYDKIVFNSVKKRKMEIKDLLCEFLYKR